MAGRASLRKMAKKGAKKGAKGKRPQTAVQRKKGDDLLDVDRPYTAPSAEATAQFRQLKTEVFGMSLYQQIAAPFAVSYFKNLPTAAMRQTVTAAEGKKGKKKGKKGKKK